MIKKIQETINLCKLCENDNYLKESILFSKPKIYFGSNSPDIMIVGHSPSVRSSKQAEVVLKMDKENQPLYKYIMEEILSPLGIERNRIYCTNLIKCNTKGLPEEMGDNDLFINSVAENCLYLLEQEIREIDPKFIISLSERVLKIISEKYLDKLMEMKNSFGKLFSLEINNKFYNYTPVVHIPRKNSKVAQHYFPEQTNRLKAISKLVNHKSFLNEYYNKLIEFNPVKFNDDIYNKVPNKAGVYAISLVKNSEYLYIGRTKNLKQRLYNNHLMGPLSNSRLKKYLIDNNICCNLDDAKNYILNECQFSYVFVDNYRERGMIEGYFTGMLKPKFGIDEEH